MINQVPTHLDVAARAGFLNATRQGAAAMNWRRVAQEIPMTAGDMTIVDLGGAPMPVESITGNQVATFIERKLEVEPKSWEITVALSYKEYTNDQTGKLLPRVMQAGLNFEKHIEKNVFTYLNGGDGTTYGLCYDEQQFFDSDHVDKGADYTTNQDNEYDLALSLDNFETVRTAATLFKDDRGEYVTLNHNLLVVPPALEREAANICGNTQDYGTANRAVNPYAGRMNYIVTPHFDSTAWVLLAESEIYKPMFVIMREQPGLQASWFDPKQPDGGMYYWKFFGQYSIYYGDWRLAIMGDS